MIKRFFDYQKKSVDGFAYFITGQLFQLIRGVIHLVGTQIFQKKLTFLIL